jgi:4-azaleucine resistance transporter AzlC
MQSSFTPRTEFLAGVRDTLPLIVGAIPLAIIFGAAAPTSGLSPAATLGMSAFVFAGSAQFIATGLIANSTATVIIILTTFVVNLRHALYSATLAPHVKHLSQRWLLPLGFWLTDETFAITVRHYSKDDGSPYKHWYYFGSAISMYLNWQLWTLIGLVAGRVIDAQRLGLDFAMVVTFIGLVVPIIRTRPELLAVLVAGVVAVLTYSFPNKLGLMVAALCGIAVGVIAESMQRKSAAPETQEQAT